MPPATPDATYGPREAMPLDMLEIGNVDAVLEGLFPKSTDTSVAEFKEKMETTAAAYARLFATQDGQAVLEHLADVTVRRPTFFAHLGIPADQIALLGAQREGANALFFLIMQFIAHGRQQTPPQREGA